MNYLIHDKISSNTLAFWTDATEDMVKWVAKKNQNRPDMIAKWDSDWMSHVLDYVQYHLQRAGYKVTPLRSKIIHRKIEVKAFESITFDITKVTIASELIGKYLLPGYIIKIGKYIYQNFKYVAGKEYIRLTKVVLIKGKLKTTYRYVKLDTKLIVEYV